MSFLFRDIETCPDGWVDGRKIGEHGGCYLFANDGQGVNWNEAKEFCEANGGYIADIMDQETQDFIAKTSGNFPEATWWIGGNDLNNTLVGNNNVPPQKNVESLYGIIPYTIVS